MYSHKERFLVSCFPFNECYCEQNLWISINSDKIIKQYWKKKMLTNLSCRYRQHSLLFENGVRWEKWYQVHYVVTEPCVHIAHSVSRWVLSLWLFLVDLFANLISAKEFPHREIWTHCFGATVFQQFPVGWGGILWHLDLPRCWDTHSCSPEMWATGPEKPIFFPPSQKLALAEGNISGVSLNLMTTSGKKKP